MGAEQGLVGELCAMAEAWVAISAPGGGADKTYGLNLGNPPPPTPQLGHTHICHTCSVGAGRRAESLGVLWNPVATNGL